MPRRAVFDADYMRAADTVNSFFTFLLTACRRRVHSRDSFNMRICEKAVSLDTLKKSCADTLQSLSRVIRSDHHWFFQTIALYRIRRLSEQLLVFLRDRQEFLDRRQRRQRTTARARTTAHRHANKPRRRVKKRNPRVASRRQP